MSTALSTDGVHVRLHPADVKGRFNTWRRVVFAVLIGFYVAAPFIPVGGHPMIQLDVAHRRFFFFGQTFNAQDFWLMLLLVLFFVFALLAVTAWRGRVWCGWACPQTVFLEGVYRPIERLFEGSREARIRLDGAHDSTRRVVLRVARFAVYLVVSAVIAHTATALFVSPKELWLMLQEGPAAHVEAFLLTLGFTAVLQFNFWWFREQFCLVMCPYGRLQSVLHDRDSITVAYDAKRGEPRGKLGRTTGACIDCKRCVVVCPTGIDIRNGLQMECLACTACIDACDEVMDKVHQPRGLIRFASERELRTSARKTVRPRLVIYSLLMLVSATALVTSLVLRTPFEANILRPRGAMPYFVDGANVRNAFEVHLFNKQPTTARFTLALHAPDGAQVVVGTPALELAPLTDARVPISVSLPRGTPGARLTLEIHDENSGAAREVPVRFITP